MLHSLLYTHPILTKIDFGIVHLCANRITGRLNKAVFYPEGYRETFDITYVDLDEFFTFRDVFSAVSWLEHENGKV